MKNLISLLVLVATFLSAYQAGVASQKAFVSDSETKWINQYYDKVNELEKKARGRTVEHNYNIPLSPLPIPPEADHFTLTRSFFIGGCNEEQQETIKNWLKIWVEQDKKSDAELESAAQEEEYGELTKTCHYCCEKDYLRDLLND